MFYKMYFHEMYFRKRKYLKKKFFTHYQNRIVLDDHEAIVDVTFNFIIFALLILFSLSSLHL